MGFQPDNSRVIDYYKMSKILYPTDPMLVHFVVDEPIRYNEKETRSLLDDLYERLLADPMALTPKFGTPWFQLMPNRDYKLMRAYIREIQIVLGISSPKKNNLKHYVQKLQNECYPNDVIFSDNRLMIMKSRFVVPFTKIDSSNFEEGTSLVGRLQNITSSMPFKVALHNFPDLL